MIIPILKYNKYNKEENFKKNQIEKLSEEIQELKNSKCNLNEIEEIQDIIQICISLLELHTQKDISTSNLLHIKKLKNRKWSFDKNQCYSVMKITRSDYLL